MNKTFVTLTSLLLVGACGTTHRLKATDYNQALLAGNYCLSAEIATSEKLCENPDSSNKLDDVGLLDSLNGGSALFACSKYEQSKMLLENADQLIYANESASMLEDGSKATVEILGNASVMDYQPMIMDGIYISSYKILDYMALNDQEGARNEVNRAYQRQQNASETFRKEIEAGKKDAAAEAEELSPEAQELSNVTENGILQAYNQEFAQWNSYKDYLNPYTTYLSGLYFMANSNGASDNENAVTYLKRVSGMSPNNKYVKQDLQLAQNLANGKSNFKNNKPATWVIFENGQVADFEEFRFDLPVFIATNDIKTVSFAVQKPKLRNAAFENISVAFEGGKQVNTQVLVDVDRMFISEYNKKFPVILSKAIASTTAKTVMQYVMQQQMGDLGGIGMAVYSVVTTSADLRSWYGLPKNVQLAKVSTSKSGKLSIFGAGLKLTEVDVPTDRNSIVYVRIPDAGAIPAVSVINL